MASHWMRMLGFGENLPVCTTMEEAYKEALNATMDQSAFKMDEHVFGRMMADVSSGIVEELNRTNKEHHLGDDLYDWQVMPILHSALESRRKAKQALSNLYCSSGRYQLRNLDMSNINVKSADFAHDRIYDSLNDNVSDFGSEYNKFSSQVWGTWRDVGNLISKNDIKPEMLLTKINRDGQAKILSESFHNVDAGAYIKLGPVEADAFIHNPDSVQTPEGSTFTLDTFKFEFIHTNKSEKARQQKGYDLFSSTCSRKEPPVVCNIPYIKCSRRVNVVCRCEFEFSITKAYIVKGWAKAFSFGINCAFDQEKTSTHTTPQFEFEVELQQSDLKLRDKPNINVSLAQATQFLEKEAQLRQMKEQLDYEKEDVKMIKDARDREIEGLLSPPMEPDDAYLSEASTLSDDASDLTDSDDEVHISAGAMSKVKKETVPTKAKNVLKKLKHKILRNGENQLESQGERLVVTSKGIARDVNRFNTASEAASAAGRTVVDKKGAMYRDVTDFNAFSRCDKNNVGGFVFEELADGRITANMADKGRQVKTIQGDGLGKVNGVETPKYTDTTFVTDKGPKVTQYKFTDAPDKLKATTESYFDTWHGKPDATKKPPNLPEEFHLENMEVYGPKEAVDGRSFNVKVDKNPETGMPEFKRITPKSEIDIDGVKTEMPKVSDVDKFSEKNFETLKDMAGDVNVIRQQRKSLSKIEKQLQGKQRAIEGMRKKNPDKTQTIENLQKQVREKTSEVNQARKQLKKQERSLQKKSGKLKSTDSKASKRQMMKGAGLQVAIGALVDGATTLVITLTEQIKLYKKGEITFGQLAGTVAKQTTIAVVRGGMIAGGLVGAQLALQQMALASSRVISGVGSVGATALGPALLIGGLSYQTFGILKAYNAGDIGTGEMQRQFGRMAATTGLSIGGMAGSVALLGAGPAGLLVGAGCCIAVALGDFFFGDAFWRLFIDDDPKEIRAQQVKHCKKFEKEVVNEAYKLFDLEENCSDEELNEARRVGYLKYHPDKCQGNQEEKDAVMRKFQALLAAFTLLKVQRKMA